MNRPIIVAQSLKGNVLFCIGALTASLLSLFLVFVNFKETHGILRVFAQNPISYAILKIIFIVSFVFFGYGFFFLVKKAKQGKNIMIVDKNGITDNSSAISVGFIPWRDIGKIYIDSMMGNDYIEICLNNEKQYINRLSALKKQAVLANKKMGHQVVCITLNSTGISPHALLPDIQKYFLEAKSSQ